MQPRCWTVFSRPSAVRHSTPSTSKVQQTKWKVAQNVLARDFAGCGLSLLQSSMTQLRFTRHCGADSFATLVSAATSVLFSVNIQVDLKAKTTPYSLPLKEAIQNALQNRMVARCSSYLRFPTTPTGSHASAYTAFTEISIQFSFHTQHSSTARKFISDISLLLLKLERFLICLLRSGCAFEKT